MFRFIHGSVKIGFTVVCYKFDVIFKFVCTNIHSKDQLDMLTIDIIIFI